jgi:hypothetical protein
MVSYMINGIHDEECFSAFAATIASISVAIRETNSTFESIAVLANVMLKAIEGMVSIPAETPPKMLFLAKNFTRIK